MINLQSNLWGENLPAETSVQEVDRMLEKFPALMDNRGVMYFFFLKESCPFLMQLPPERINEIKAFCHRIESIRRRAQDYKASIPQ